MFTEIELFDLCTELLEIFVRGIGWRAKFAQEMWIHDTHCCLAFGCCCPHKDTRSSTQAKNALSSRHKLQSTLRLTVGYSNIYYKL